MLTAVTGAAGHVGANLTRQLLEAGHKVRACVYNDTRGVTGLDVEQAPIDVLDPPSLVRAFEGVDVVYHLAAVISIYGDPDGVMSRTNIEGAGNVAQACLQAGVRRMVHFSSIHAYSHLPLDQPIDERRGPAQSDAPDYDRTKAGGEVQVLRAVEAGLDAVILNPTAVLGPYDYKPSHMGQVLLDLCRGKFPALVEGGFDWVDVRDVVQAALVAAESGRRGEKYLLSGKWAPFAELAALVERVTGVRAPRFVTPMWLARLGAPFVSTANQLMGKRPLYTSDSLRALRCHKLVVSHKAERELGYRARPLEQTISAVFDWFAGAGMLSD